MITWCRRVLQRAHVHQGKDCAVCFGAASPSAATATTVTSASKHHGEEKKVTTPSRRVYEDEAPSIIPGTIEELRETAMRQFVNLRLSSQLTSSPASVSHRRGEELWERLYAPGPKFTDAEYDELVQYCTSFTSGITLSGVPSSSSLCSAPAADASETSTLALEIQSSNGKQKNFFFALRDVLHSIGTVRNGSGGTIEPFVCCGTALGFRRQGMFIPHDEDIDLGIRWESLGPDPSQAVLDLLSTIAHDGHSVCFDVCGEIEKGLELRLKHLKTGVLVDINVYYPSCKDDVVDGGSFVWCATHYEESDRRKHGMYRYRHIPFYDAMERATVRLDDGSSRVCHVLVPPVTYLEEYFGSDWRIPKQYSYREGLHGEYKNIIPE